MRDLEHEIEVLEAAGWKVIELRRFDAPQGKWRGLVYHRRHPTCSGRGWGASPGLALAASLLAYAEEHTKITRPILPPSALTIEDLDL